MASSYGNSSSGSPNSGSDEDLRKRKRMESNRESAKRSRMRKQQHLEELKGHAAQLRNENDKISRKVNMTSQGLISVETENAFLRAQVMELTQTLNSLNQILDSVNNSSCLFKADQEYYDDMGFVDDGLMLNNSWNFVGFPFSNQQSIVASAQMFH